VFDWLANPESWAALATLTVLEVVLGIDNIVFLSILVDRLPPAEQKRARFIGLSLAMVARIALLFSITWVMGLTRPLFAVFGQEVSGRDLILLLGGLFLIGKATHEIHDKLEGPEDDPVITGRPRGSYASLFTQIVLIDLVFSLDSVITAVGMAKDVGVMVTAVVIAVLFMMAFAGPVSNFVNRHPTVKMLALSFLVLIGVALIADGLGQHIPKGYIYFAMAFSVMVEMLNLRLKKKTEPVRLHQHLPGD
jgi:predicted tellurium resistance membrane protein TerC